MQTRRHNVGVSRDLLILAVVVVLSVVSIGAVIVSGIRSQHQRRDASALEAVVAADAGQLADEFDRQARRIAFAAGDLTDPTALALAVHDAAPEATAVAVFGPQLQPTPATFVGAGELVTAYAPPAQPYAVSHLYNPTRPHVAVIVRRDVTGVVIVVDYEIRSLSAALQASRRFDSSVAVAALQILPGTELPAVAELRGSPANRRQLVARVERGDLAVSAAIRNAPFGLVAYASSTSGRSEAFWVLAAIVFCTVITAIAGVIATRVFLRRVRRVTVAALALRDGKAPIHVDDSNPDDIGRLARSFNELADSLQGDARRRRDVETRLSHLAGHDSLTGLPNRTMVRRRIEELLGEQRNPGNVAVMFLDLDQFKTVNDGLGHSVGDLLLCEVAFKLRAASDVRCTLARFGGDEFVVVAHDMRGEGDAIEVAERLRSALSAPVRVANRMFSVGVSIGVALAHADSTAETLIQEADAAMYRAKELGRHRVVMYDDEIRTNASDRLNSMIELHRAIVDDSLRIVVQPIVNLNTSELIGVEALVRWNLNGTDLDPGEFVSHAAELDLATELDNWVINRVCEIGELLQPMITQKVGWLHLNATIATLDDPTFPRRLAELAETHNLAINTLCLEVPEGYLSAAPESLLATLRELRRRGVHVALDDFGTGYSSLSRLGELPVDIVKIDQSFVHNIETEPTRQAIVEAMVAMARRLRIGVYAEGVERESQREVLLRLGCDVGQGFLLGMPMSASEFGYQRR